MALSIKISYFSLLHYQKLYSRQTLADSRLPFIGDLYLGGDGTSLDRMVVPCELV